MGITDELIEEAFEESDDEVEVDSEVGKIFDEMGLDTAALMDAGGAVNVTPAAIETAPAAKAAPKAAAVAAGGGGGGAGGEEQGGGADDDDLMARLRNLQK